MSDEPIFGPTYADCYDLFYQTKDYEAECDLLEALFQQPVLDPRVRETSSRRYHEIAGLLEEKVARWEILAARDAG